MRNFAIAFTAILVLAAVVWAQNNIEWTGISGDARTGLDTNGLANTSDCALLQFDSSDATTDESRFVFIGGKGFTFQFEPDNTGTNTTATVGVYACTSRDGNADGVVDLLACDELYLIDTDADGTPDTNVFDGTTAGRRGMLSPIYVAGWVYFSPAVLPGAGDEADIVVCNGVLAKAG